MPMLPDALQRMRQRLFRQRAEDSLPHTISHQRIYIVPSRRGAAFLLALLIMLIASINYALSLGHALSFLLTGLFASSLLHTYRNLAGLQVLQIEAEDCFAGETLHFQITLFNARTTAVQGVRLACPNGDTHGIRIRAGERICCSLAVATERRGVRPLGRLTLHSDWPLGLWTCWSYLHVPVNALVYPAPEANAPALPMKAGHRGQGARQIAVQGDVAGLRDYRPGDSLGSVAWKRAARGQSLQVRDMDSPGAATLTHLDLQTTGCHDTELRLSRLSAWVLQAQRQGGDWSLSLPGLQLASGRGASQQRQALRALAMLDSGSTPT